MKTPTVSSLICQSFFVQSLWLYFLHALPKTHSCLLNPVFAVSSNCESTRGRVLVRPISSFNLCALLNAILSWNNLNSITGGIITPCPQIMCHFPHIVSVLCPHLPPTDVLRIWTPEKESSIFFCVLALDSRSYWISKSSDSGKGLWIKKCTVPGDEGVFCSLQWPSSSL